MDNLAETQPTPDLLLDNPAKAAPTIAAPAPLVLAQEGMVATTGAPKAQEIRSYPSLYDTRGTTVLAITLGLLIVAGIQIGIYRIFKASKTEHHALTQFVMSMVGLVLAIYVCDMLIAGPETELLAEAERVKILDFIKDICLIVFAYYFGTRATPPADVSPSDNSEKSE
jgi:hypothetical protein